MNEGVALYLMVGLVIGSCWALYAAKRDLSRGRQLETSDHVYIGVMFLFGSLLWPGVIAGWVLGWIGRFFVGMAK